MKKILSFFLLITIYDTCLAQDNYEIQVYGAETVEKRATMFELHSNYTFEGQKNQQNEMFSTHNMLHETIEITHGFTTWFETGFYFFNAVGSNNRTGFTGSHIRPRARVPESWNWPFGASLSLEFGYQNRAYSQDDVTLEVRPIIDKKWKDFYVSFNPTFDKSFHGLNSNIGYVFSPDLKASYNVTKKVAGGLEYYGSVGTLGHLAPYQQQQHQLFIVTDIDFSPDWEFNCGYGWGFTQATDNAIFKVILGYRVHKKVRTKEYN
jgi:hypothetical protein